MNINVQAVNFNVKTNLTEFLERKLIKLDSFYDKIIGANVYFKLENTKEKDNKIVEIKLEVPGDNLVVKKIASTFEEGIDLSCEALKKMIMKKKEKH